MRNTIILFWNPEISSFTMQAYCELMKHCQDAYMNWSVWEHEKAKNGDRFYLVRCGKEPNGIVMSGELCSDPYIDEDWSGKGREVYYMDLNIEYMGDPNGHLLSSDILTKNIPNFNWHGGHSGRLIESEDDIARLEMLWHCYVEDVIQDENDYRWQNQLDEYLSKKHGSACEICGYDYRKLFGDQENYNEYFYIGDLGCRDCDEIERNYHCLCLNCIFLIDNCMDMDRAKAFEKYQSLAMSYAQKLQLMDRFMDNYKSLKSFLSEAKTSKLNQKVDYLLEKVADKSDVLMHGYDKYRAFMDFLKNNKNKS